jgi:uncharacterized membrane protein
VIKVGELHGWLVFIHVVAAMVWVGGAAVLSSSAIWALRQPEPGAVARFVRSLRVTGPIVFAPAPALLVAAGVWMVVDDDAWAWDQAWIRLGLGMFAAAFLVGAGYTGRAVAAAGRAVAAGDDVEAARQLRRWASGALVVLGLLLVATWGMVFKPGV